MTSYYNEIDPYAAQWLRDAEPMGLLAHGIEARVGKLRALGNAIVPAVAAEVIAAFMDCQPAQGGLFA